MTGSVRIVNGAVLRLRCGACAAIFPHFSFSGEEDSDTAGLYSASSCNQDEVVLAEADPSEWKDLAHGEITSIEKKLAQNLARDDLKVVRLLRIEHQSSAAAGSSFADFRKAYKPPVLVYSCICCSGGEARALQEMTMETFRRSGGRILLTGRVATAQ